MDKIKIMIDAGHYGKYNRSPAYPEYWESLMAWDLHLLLAAELENYGFTVGRTRNSKEKDLDVYNRGMKAEGYDIFLSLHSNAVGSERNDEIDYPVIYLLANDTKGIPLAKELSSVIAEEMATKQEGRIATRLQNNGMEYYGVLRGAKAVGCPHAFIIEHSFHTALAPAKWLNDNNNLKKLAKAEAEKIAGFYNIKKEEDDLTKEEVQALIDASKERVWHYWDEIKKDAPWAYEPLMKLYEKGLFKGMNPSDLNISQTKMETLVVLSRALDDLKTI